MSTNLERAQKSATIPVLSKDEVIERLAACVVDLRRWHELESSYGSKTELREQMRDYMFLLGGEENDLDRHRSRLT